jgi:hypothetical protein
MATPLLASEPESCVPRQLMLVPRNCVRLRERMEPLLLELRKPLEGSVWKLLQPTPKAQVCMRSCHFYQMNTLYNCLLQ